MTYLKITTFYPQSRKQLKGGQTMKEQNKKPQTTHGSEQFEGEELIEIASSLLSDYNNQTVENLPEYSSRLIRYVNNL